MPDEVCRYFEDLAAYDYRPPHQATDDAEVSPGTRLVDVDILGHIFEQSISDLERLREELDGLTERLDRAAHTSRRKKEGAFYTPAFITRYIVGQALGSALEDRFETLRLAHAGKAGAGRVLANPRVYDLAAINARQQKALIGFWEAWQDELATVKILDPACGSGAFLIEAFEQLYTAYQRSNDRLEELRGSRTLFDLDRRILQNNLYGVDLNEEAIEIGRLSLWIKTAQRGKPLTSLDHTLRVGNSVIADRTVHPMAFDWHGAFPEVFAHGGFDVVVGNPPYVRQEWISPYKSYLQQAFRSYHGMADLYVYFYEQGMRVLRPGGRLSFIVTNKWLKAAYGEPLRRFFADSTWVASVVDFGHAKQIFEDADVFPSIIVARKPAEFPAPATTRVCAIPRELLRINDLTEQINAEGIDIERSRLTGEAWSLEPRAVIELMAKIRDRGTPLTEFAGVKPYRGVVTGFNEAFLIDSSTRDALLADDPKSAEIIKPFLRGQDVRRWSPEWAGLWMIFARKGIDIDAYPAVKEHLAAFRQRLEPKPRDWTGGTWLGRKAGPYQWYEIQDPVDYWPEFAKPKIVYQEIQYRPSYSFDGKGYFGNNKTFFIATGDLYLLSVLNSPLLWWHNWRFLPHMKDEALSPVGFLIEKLPVARPRDKVRTAIESASLRLIEISDSEQTVCRDMLDWLKIEHDITGPSMKLQSPVDLDSDSLIAEVKKLRGRRRPLSLAAVRNLREEHARTIIPAQALAREGNELERKISDLVNSAYGLTPAEVELMWETAPPRMPGSRV